MNLTEGRTADGVFGFYSTQQVCALTTWSKTTLWRQWTQGYFPKPVKISSGRVGFPRERVDAWFRAKMAEVEMSDGDIEP